MKNKQKILVGGPTVYNDTNSIIIVKQFHDWKLYVGWFEATIMNLNNDTTRLPKQENPKYTKITTIKHAYKKTNNKNYRDEYTD